MNKYLTIILCFFLMCVFVTGCGNDKAQGTEGIDVDLTPFSTTLLYAETAKIYENPEKYIGKTIKMKGLYFNQFNDQTNQNYHYVIIEKADNCCMSGLEFIWSGEHKFPEDYPELYAEIEVVGVFDSYEELGQKCYCLKIDELAV